MLQIRMRCGLLVCIFGALATTSDAGEPWNDAVPYSQLNAAQKQRVAARKREQDAIRRRYSYDIAGAVRLTQQMLQRDFDVFLKGDEKEVRAGKFEMARSMNFWADTLYRNEDFVHAKKSKTLEGALYEELYGANDWRVNSVRWRLRVWEQMLQPGRRWARDIYGDTWTDMGTANDLKWSKPDQALPYAQRSAKSFKDLLARFQIPPEQNIDYAEAIDRMADCYYTQGKYALAEKTYRQALDIFVKGGYGPNHPRYAETVVDLADTHKRVGAHSQAEMAYREALEILNRCYAGPNRESANLLANLGRLYYDQDKTAQAETTYRAALAMYRESDEPYAITYDTAMKGLGRILRNAGKVDEAEEIFTKLLTFEEKEFGAESVAYSNTCSDLGHVLMRRNEYQKALDYYLKNTRIKRKFYKTTHSEYGVAYVGVAWARFKLGQLEKAEQNLTGCVANLRARLGDQNSETRGAVNKLETVLSALVGSRLKKGEFKEAREAVDKIRGIRVSMRGDKHWTVARLNARQAYADTLERLNEEQRTEVLRSDELYSQANQLQSEKKYVEAIEASRESLEIRKKFLGETSWFVAESQYQLASCLISNNQQPEAEILERECIGTYQATIPEGSLPPEVAHAAYWLGGQHRARGERVQALKLYDDAAAIYKSLYGRFDNWYINSILQLARVNNDGGNYQKAEILFRQVTDVRRRTSGISSTPFVQASRELAWLMYRTNQVDEAELRFRELLEVYEKKQREPDIHFFLIHNQLALVLQSQGRLDESASAFRELLTQYPTKFSESDSNFGIFQANLGQTLQKMGQLEEAEKMLRSAVELHAKSNYRFDHAVLRLIEILKQKMESSLASGDRATAVTAAEEAQALNGDYFGVDHWRTKQVNVALQPLQSLNQLEEESIQSFVDAVSRLAQVRELREAGKFDEALVEVEKTCELLGTLDEGQAFWLHATKHRAELYAAVGRFQESVALGKQLISRSTESLGADHPLVAELQNQIGELFFQSGQFAEARGYFQQARETFLKREGMFSVGYGLAACRLGKCYLKMGNITDADSELRTSLNCLRAAQVEHLPKYCEVLDALAELHFVLGDEPQYDEFARQAFQSSLRFTGSQSASHAAASRRFAHALWRRAAFLEQEVQRMQTKLAYGLSSGNESQTQLIQVLIGMKEKQIDEQREMAEAIMDRAIGLYQLRFGVQSLEFADCLIDVADFRKIQGQLPQADKLLQLAAAIVNRNIGTKNLIFARILHARGVVQMKQADFEAAQEQMQLAMTLHKQFGSDAHPDFVAALRDLGDLAIQRGEKSQAKAFYRQHLKRTREFLDTAAFSQTELQQIALSKSSRGALDRVLAVSEGEADQREVYEFVLAFKGSAFQRQVAMRAARTQAELRPKFTEWERVTGKLATVATRLPFPEEENYWRHHVAFLAEEKRRLEIELLRSAKRFGSKADIVQEGWTSTTLESLQAAIPDDGTALVDFLEYESMVPDGEQSGKWKPERRLTGFVVQPGKPLRRFELGKADNTYRDMIYGWIANSHDLVQLVSTLLNAGENRPPGLQEAIAEQATKASVRAGLLKKQIWNPMSDAIRESNTIIISPDGDLSAFPLAALPGDSAEFLLEEKAIAIMPVPSVLPDLLNRTTSTAHDTSALLLGGLDFNARPETRENPLDRIELGNQPQTVGSALVPRFAPVNDLKNMLPEIERLASMIRQKNSGRTRILKGADGSELQLRKHAASHRWLHFATHGFYNPSMVLSAHLQLKPRTPIGTSPGKSRGTPEIPSVVIQPGLSTGLTLAGVNEVNSQDEDDGILWGMEVAAMDLSDVEMVVLSACDTASGVTAGGEGVLSLQRDFQVAGARNVISTLWPVNDEASRLLMQRYYDNLLNGRNGKEFSKLEAIREAQVWMLDAARKTTQESQTGPDEALSEKSTRLPMIYRFPAIWSPFIMNGDWR